MLVLRWYLYYGSAYFSSVTFLDIHFYQIPPISECYLEKYTQCDLLSFTGNNQKGQQFCSHTDCISSWY